MGTFCFYTTVNFKKSLETGGTKRFKELMYGLLEKGDTVHLFIPSNEGVAEFNNLHIHKIRQGNMRFLPKGIQNFFLNYIILSRARRINYNNFIVFSVPYAIQLVFVGLGNLIFLAREDFILSRTIELDDRKMPLFAKRILVRAFVFLENIVIKRSNLTVVQSLLDKNTLLRRHNLKDGVDTVKIKVLYNNVNPSWLRDRVINKCSAVLSNSLKIVFVGNVNDKKKGLHILLAAVFQLIKRDIPLQLTIIGSGKLIEGYKTLYNHDDIRFLGKISDPLPTIADSDLMIVPSLTDSFPNTVLEALYCDTPVIGSKVGGIPEILEFDKLLFEPTEESLEKKIQGIIQLNELEELSLLCRRRKKALMFDWIEEFKKQIP